MESSQTFGGIEECHSCESGWTMYIGSPMYGGPDDDDNEHSDDDDNGDNNDDDNNGDDDDDEDDGKNYRHEDDSDDSMASDASSGPSHQGMTHVYNHEEEGKDKNHQFHLQRKTKKPMEKQKAESRRKDEKEETVSMGKRGNAPAQSASKVRKSFWTGKRK